MSRQRVDDPGLRAEKEVALGFDLQRLEPEFLEDPYPTYHRLRRWDPVHRGPDGSYFLTRYDDVAAVYRDHARLSSDKKVEFKPKFGNGPLFEHHTTSLVFRDPPDHTRLRRLFAAAFTPKALAALQPRVVRLVDGLLDRAATQGGMDLIADYAFALPVELIGDMLGVPRADRPRLRDWSLAILGALEPVPGPDRLVRGNRAVEEFKAFLRALCEDRRRHPLNDDGEVLSKLIIAEDEQGALSEVELLHQCIFLLNAGHETTTNLIGNGVHALLEHPGELRRLQDDSTLIETAIEEFLRYESSNQLGNRRALVDVEIGGVALPAGTLITLGIGAANRDPAQFPDPDRLDIARAPNRHLAFATGIHACAGMWLARMEGQVAIGRLVRRFPKIRQAGPVVRGGRARFRGLAQFPVSV
jgi:cytochrome P450